MSLEDELKRCDLEIERTLNSLMEDERGFLGLLGYYDWHKERKLILREMEKEKEMYNVNLARNLTPEEYISRAVAMESNDYEVIAKRMIETIRLDHAAKGLCTEAGEFIDALKKFQFYGREIDKVNLKEELGDLLWYVALACDELKISLSEVFDSNINKLEFRYRERKFKETQAKSRDLEKEREILER